MDKNYGESFFHKFKQECYCILGIKHSGEVLLWENNQLQSQYLLFITPLRY